MSGRLLIRNLSMDQLLPTYRDPPVVETALSVQFKPVRGLRNAHLGLFWQQSRDSFPTVTDAEPIESQEETFGGHRQRLPSFRFATGHQGARLQMESRDGHMMIQLQNGRLVYNWRRMDDGLYPRWDRVLPEFLRALARFSHFLEAESLPSIVPIQWEVTYVNKFVRGREWRNSAEWTDVVPGLIGTACRLRTARLETIRTDWHFVLPESAGRLHVDVTHGFDGPEEEAEEFLILQLTTRGGIDEEKGHDLNWGLNTGREAIVRSFSEITGKGVQTLWGKKR